MALMTEERRKEMEEEMSRFELEILGPEDSVGKAAHIRPGQPLEPPPRPLAVTALIPPKALIKAPPPPPPPPPPLSPPPLKAVLRPPPPPPMLHGPRPRFIPPQVQRHPPRGPMRPPLGMRGPPMGHHPNNFPGPYGPQMGQHPMYPGPVMHHSIGPMFPGPPMHQMNMPMPPGFHPPGGNQMSHQNQQSYSAPPSQEISAPPKLVGETRKVLESAPAIYAAPFMKKGQEPVEVAPLANGPKELVAPPPPPVEKVQLPKPTDEPTVGPMLPPIPVPEEIVVSKKKEKKKKIVRMAGGQAWEDNSLLDWDNDDFRIFCGDLGNDVTDEVLIRAFSKYQSFGKAKVIRDKRTNKTKGFGFVSFKDPQDFIKAMREMNGRYVGSRPIKLRKSTWKDRNIDIVKKKQREKEKLGLL